MFNDNVKMNFYVTRINKYTDVYQFNTREAKSAIKPQIHFNTDFIF